MNIHVLFDIVYTVNLIICWLFRNIHVQRKRRMETKGNDSAGEVTDPLISPSVLLTTIQRVQAESKFVNTSATLRTFYGESFLI